jgi:hypothetical protein
MTKVVTAARRAVGQPAHQPAAGTGAGAVYRKLFDSFNPDKDGRISQWEVLTRLQRSGLQPDDPRIAEALTGLKAADGSSRRIDFGQFKALAKHNSSLIRRAVEGNLAVPDFSALTSDIDWMYRELLPLRSGSVADYIPQLRRIDRPARPRPASRQRTSRNRRRARHPGSRPRPRPRGSLTRRRSPGAQRSEETTRSRRHETQDSNPPGGASAGRRPHRSARLDRHVRAARAAQAGRGNRPRIPGARH